VRGAPKVAVGLEASAGRDVALNENHVGVDVMDVHVLPEIIREVVVHDGPIGGEGPNLEANLTGIADGVIGHEECRGTGEFHAGVRRPARHLVNQVASDFTVDCGCLVNEVVVEPVGDGAARHVGVHRHIHIQGVLGGVLNIPVGLRENDIPEAHPCPWQESRPLKAVHREDLWGVCVVHGQRGPEGDVCPGA
jgi:hypothetical protein